MLASDGELSCSLYGLLSLSGAAEARQNAMAEWYGIVEALCLHHPHLQLSTLNSFVPAPPAGRSSSGCGCGTG